MEKIYRVRPIDDNTLSELTTPYLWFSKPKYFEDENDANIRAFVNNDNLVANALRRKYDEKELDELIDQMQDIGICCFTDSLPDKNSLNIFLRGINGICVEYNKEVLEDWFRQGIPYYIPCGFMGVEYFSNGAEIEKCDDYHYLKKRGDDYCVYCSITHLDKREFNNFMFKVLLNKSTEYENEREQRLILGPMNFEYLDKRGKGYRIEIPQEAICAVHVYNEDDRAFLGNLDEVLPISVVD